MKNKYKIIQMCLGFMSLFTIGLNDVKASTLVQEQVPNVFYARYGGDKPYGSSFVENYTMDGKAVYCIEPGIAISTNEYIGKVGWINSPLSHEINQKIQLVGYYGYDYPNHHTQKFRLATQSIIWEIVSGQKIELWTQINGNGDYIDVDYERNEIMKLVNKHYIKPSFNNAIKIATINQPITLYDSNEVLSEYEIYKSDNATSVINGNNLTIAPSIIGDINIFLKRKTYTSDPTVIFVGIDNKSQKMGFFGLSDPIESIAKLKSYGSKINIKKVDSENNSTTPQGQATLIGAKYNIIDSNNNIVDTLTIDENSTATSTKYLGLGTYTIKEIVAPNGYHLNTETYTATITSNDTLYINVSDEVIKGKIKINKYDSETNTCKSQGQATLVGAKFNILDHNNNIVDTLTIDDNCTATSKNLPYGNYTIKEISAPNGYHLNNNTFKQTITENKIYEITIENDIIKNFISILKQYDYVDGNTTFLNAEANITFEIFYQNNDKYGEITTDKNGYATLNIPYGNWRFHQVNTNTGYEKIYDFYITIDENSEKEQYYNILNNKLSAYLKVIKKDSETGNIIALANTTFKILNTDTNQFVTQFVAGKIYDKFTTDETGTFTTYLKLEAGNYKLIEVESPSGYLISKDGLDFTIGTDTEYNYTNYGAIVVKEFYNTQIKGQIEILKKGEEFIINNGTFNYDKIPLDGIKYHLYAEEDIKTSDGTYLYYHKGDLVEILITNKDGYAKSKLLPLGKYFIMEVETKDNYILDSEKHHFKLTEKDNTTKIVYETINTLNYLKKGTFEFTKTDLATSDPIPNVEFKIYTDKDELVFAGKTDNNGKIIIKDLVVGKYYIVETKANEGYLSSDEKIFFEIKENGEIIKANMTNKKITSTLKITKIDEDNNKLSGVKFEIYDLNDNLISEHITDEDGYFEIKLNYGKYYFKEISTLDNYIITNEKIYFDVLEDGSIIEKTITNNYKTGTLELTKIDLVDGTPIPNTLFQIFNEKDELIFEGLTNDKGLITIENLRYGKYYIIEKEANTNYQITDEKLFFEIRENGEIVKATMTNEKIVVEIPKTYINDSIIITIISISGIIVGLGFIIYDKKRK